MPVGWSEAILRHIVQLVFGLVSAIALTLPLINMTDTDFASMDFKERSLLIVQLAPFWFKIANWGSQVWMWSEFVVLLLNKRKRALHDYVAGTVVIKKKYVNLAEQYAGDERD